MQEQNILQFEDVTFAARPPYEAGLDGVSFALAAGELVLVKAQAGLSRHPLADLAEGLVAPDAGRVLFLGEDWQAMPAARAAARRGGIGRVFESHGWISNLDVDENITLARRHHTTRPVEEIDREAEDLARRFGLPGLPRVRPALMRRADLRRAEWARAFLGAPGLVLLEHPEREVHTEARVRLAEAARAACGRGAAVLWITADPQAWAQVAGAANRRFELGESKLVPVKGE